MSHRHLNLISAILVILAVGAVESAGTRYRIDAIARKYQYAWPRLIEILDLVTAKLNDREEEIPVLFGNINIKLSDGKLYGIANATIRPQDKFYAITKDPLHVEGKLTFPRLEADYAYDTFLASGRMKVVIKDVTNGIKMDVRPESKTESVDPSAKVESYGNVEVTFSGSKLDGIMSLFEGLVRKKLAEILQNATSKITQKIKERINRDLPSLAQMVTTVVSEEIHGNPKNAAL